MDKRLTEQLLRTISRERRISLRKTIEFILELLQPANSGNYKDELIDLIDILLDMD